MRKGSRAENNLGAPSGAPQDFPVLRSPGFTFWKWDAAAGEIRHAPEWPLPFSVEGRELPGANENPWWRRVLGEDKPLLKEACARCLAGPDASFDLALRVERLDMHWAWLTVRGVVQVNSGGERELAGYATDVSRLAKDKRFFPHLQKNADTYAAMLENSPDPIFRWDRELYPLYANPAVSRMLPVPVEELGNTTVWELGVPEEVVNFHRRNVEAVFESGAALRETGRFNTVMRGETVSEYSYWPEFGPDGKVKSVICQVRDLTAQVRAEEAKRLNDERLIALSRLGQLQDASEEDIIEFVLDQMALLTKSSYSYLFFPNEGDGTKGRLHLSRFMRSLPGVDEWPTDRLPEIFLPEEPGLGRDLTQVQVANYRGEGHYYQRYRDTYVTRFVRLAALENGRAVCVASVGNKAEDYDETDVRQLELFLAGVWLLLRRKRNMKALELAKESAEAANHAKDEFLANVSHELRTPLNGVLGMLQLLQSSGLTGEQAQFVEAADLSGRSLLRILSDILDFSRMESGKMTLLTGRFDLKATLASTMRLFVNEARRKSLDVAVDIDENIPAVLWGDDARVRQILFNLAGNAIKFTEQGGIGMKCSLLPYRPEGNIWVYLAISDTGIGMPPEAHGAIFEAFTQLDGTHSRKYAGTGLGLGIVARLVQAMGGSLTVESAPGEGTTMHVSLPFAVADEDELRAEAAARPGGPSAAVGGRRLDILVAEDDTVSRFAIQVFLRRAGHRAVCVPDGKQALEALSVYPFDCLISDIQMPVMDGLEAARRIRQGDYADIEPGSEALSALKAVIPEADLARRAAVPTDLPLVALTAHAMAGDREHFLRMGMDLYLSKPVITEELHAVLAQVALSRRARAAPKG